MWYHPKCDVVSSLVRCGIILSVMWYHPLYQLASKHSLYLKQRFEINNQIVNQDTNSACLS